MDNPSIFIVRSRSTKNYYCVICNVRFEKENNVERHVNARCHRNAEKKYAPDIRLENNVFHCSQCKCKIPRCVDVYRHITGNQHSSGAKTIDWKSLERYARSFVFSHNDDYYYCTICNCFFLKSENRLNEHVMGNRHRHIIDNCDYYYILPLANGRFYCVCCDITIDKYCSIFSHINDKKHARSMDFSAKERLKKPISWDYAEYLFASPFVTKDSNDEFYCMICDCSMSNRENLLVHVKSPSHVEIVKLHESYIVPLEDDWYFCKLCTAVIPRSTNIHNHANGRKHSDSMLPGNWNFRGQYVFPFVYHDVNKDEFYCMICDEYIRKRKSLEIHVNGESHVTRVKRDICYILPNLHKSVKCWLCNCVIPFCEGVTRHVEGMKHSLNVKLANGCTQKQRKPSEWTRNKCFVEPFLLRKNCNEFYCMICNLPVVSKTALDIHARSESHRTAFDKHRFAIIPLENNLYQCILCNCIISRYTHVYNHLNAKRHVYLMRVKKFNDPKTSDGQRDERRNGEDKEIVTREVKNLSTKHNTDNVELKTNYFQDFGDRYTVTKSESYRITEEKCLDGTLDRSFAYDTSIVKTKIVDRSKRSERVNDMRNFDDTQLNFSLDFKSSTTSIDDTTNFHRNKLNDIIHRLKQFESPQSFSCSCSMCSSSLKNKYHNSDCAEKTIAEKTKSPMRVGLDTIFLSMNEELASLLKQLRHEEYVKVGKNTNETCTEGRNDILEKFPSGASASSKVESLISVIRCLTKRSIWHKIDKNANANVNNSLNERILQSKISGLARYKMNHAIESNETIQLDTQQTLAESTDSGNEDSSPLCSTSTIFNVNSRVNNHADINEDIYDTKARINSITFDMNFRFVIDSEDDYCMICRGIVSNEFDKNLEHLWDREHVERLKRMENDDARLALTAGSYSELSLAREYIEVFSEHSTRCLVCQCEIRNSDDALRQHIVDCVHREGWEEMRSRAKKNIDHVASQFECNWYKVQLYECAPCSKKFNQETEFVEHFDDEEHSSVVEKRGFTETERIYDFCAHCALLWCAYRTAHTTHRQSFTHRWYLKHGSFTITALPESIIELLAGLENIHDHELVEPNIDVMEEITNRCRASIVNAHDKGTGHYGERLFGTKPPIEDVKLIQFFNKICPSSRKMLCFLKRWLMKCDLSGSEQISTIALYWYMILYFQTVSILPSIASLNSMKVLWHEIADWEDFSKMDSNVGRQADTSLGLKDHLVGFFALYANFDYRYDVALPLLGRVIEKRAFAEIQALPDEMESYVFYMNNTEDPGPFRIDTVMCLQDPFDLQDNLTKAVGKADVSRFRTFCSKSLDVLCSS